MPKTETTQACPFCHDQAAQKIRCKMCNSKLNPQQQLDAKLDRLKQVGLQLAILQKEQADLLKWYEGMLRNG